MEQCTVAGTSRRKLEWKEEAEGSSSSRSSLSFLGHYGDTGSNPGNMAMPKFDYSCSLDFKPD